METKIQHNNYEEENRKFHWAIKGDPTYASSDMQKRSMHMCRSYGMLHGQPQKM